MAVTLPCAMFNLPSSQWDKGPGGDTGTPKWGGTVYVPSLSSVVADIATANTNNTILVTNFAGSRQTWTDDVGGKRIYNATKYETNVRKWTVAGGATSEQATAVTNALASRRMIAYTVDEPFHSTFNGSLPKETQNYLGLLHKSIWPGCITVQRSDGGSMTPAPASGWTGIDYGWAQFEANHFPSAGKTFSQFYSEQKAALLALNCGMIPGLNFNDGGHYTNSEGVNACWDYLNNASSNGLIKGTFSGDMQAYPPGTGITCGARPASETRFYSSPDWVKRCADIVFNDLDAPLFAMWTYPYATWSQQATWSPLFLRADVVAALDYMLNKFATRASWTGWRTAKGAGQAPPPAPVGNSLVGTAKAAAASVTLPTHLAGDMILIFAYRINADNVSPSLPAGYTAINNGGANSVAHRCGYKVAASGAETSGTWTNATGIIAHVYRGTLQADPRGLQAAGSGTTATMTYQVGTGLEIVDGTSWIAAFGVHAAASDLGGTLSGAEAMTMRQTAAGGVAASYDTSGGTATWVAHTDGVNASGGWRTQVVEVIADPGGAPPPVNQAPVLAAIGNKTVEELATLTFTASATDAGGDTIEYGLYAASSPVPAGATINPTTGGFSWTPTVDQAGTHTITVRATDITGSNPSLPYDDETITITVTVRPFDPGPVLPPEPTGPPVISAVTGGLSSLT